MVSLDFTSLYLVNIQANLKLHPPTKTFWIRSCQLATPNHSLSSNFKLNKTQT